MVENICNNLLQLQKLNYYFQILLIRYYFNTTLMDIKMFPNSSRSTCTPIAKMIRPDLNLP